MPFTVRIRTIELEDFRNVGRGKIETKNPRRSFLADVTGIFGPNGSGKSAAIAALKVLKAVLRGEALDESVLGEIRDGKSRFRLAFCFGVDDGKGTVFDVGVEFKVRSRSGSRTESGAGCSVSFLPEIFDERIEYSVLRDGVRRRSVRLADTRDTDIIRPKARAVALLRGTGTTPAALRAERHEASQKSVSYLFSDGFLSLLRSCAEAEISNEVFRDGLFLMDRLRIFGTRELFVIDARENGLRIPGELIGAAGGDSDIVFPRFGAAQLSSGSREAAEKVTEALGTVLGAIIPGMTLRLRTICEAVGPKDDPSAAEAVIPTAVRNGVEIPLSRESEGIRRLVGRLVCLTAFFSGPSVTLVADDLDGGLSEPLFGELLYVLSAQGRGQLIFTAHCLRPLETVDRGFIVFSTLDSECRFERLTNVKGTNNLRDLYLRFLKLSADSERFSDLADRADLSLAFIRAGSRLSEEFGPA